MLILLARLVDDDVSQLKCWPRAARTFRFLAEATVEVERLARVKFLDLLRLPEARRG
jgi:hypothetical protein